ncbi:MAG: Crp/Fnr family transcriptional regulator [Pseudolabrys sp.]
MDARVSIGTNSILQHLSAKTMALIEPHIHRMRVAQGVVLQETGEPITNVYFPLSGMVSMLAVLKNGAAIEAGIIGREGYVGGYLGPRGWRPFGHAVMQMSGDVMRLNVRHFKKAYDASDELRILTNGYQSVVHFQAQQTAACQALHQVEPRMCRWLLQAQDAVGGNTLNLTQEFLSHMLGVRRTSVSASANKLQAKGLISYKRGVITILDRKALEKSACECYAAVSRAIADAMPKD